VDIDYDLLVQKLKEAEAKPKKLTGRAYWAHLRKEKNKLEENYIAPESGAPLVGSEEFTKMIENGTNWSWKEREAIKIALANLHRKGR
jgi:hypothetical protein